MVLCSLKQASGLTCDLNVTQPKYLGCMLIPGGAQSVKIWLEYLLIFILLQTEKPFVYINFTETIAVGFTFFF